MCVGERHRCLQDSLSTTPVVDEIADPSVDHAEPLFGQPPGLCLRGELVGQPARDEQLERRITNLETRLDALEKARANNAKARTHGEDAAAGGSD